MPRAQTLQRDCLCQTLAPDDLGQVTYFSVLQFLHLKMGIMCITELLRGLRN